MPVFLSLQWDNVNNRVLITHIKKSKRYFWFVMNIMLALGAGALLGGPVGYGVVYLLAAKVSAAGAIGAVAGAGVGAVTTGSILYKQPLRDDKTIADGDTILTIRH